MIKQPTILLVVVASYFLQTVAFVSSPTFSRPSGYTAPRQDSVSVRAVSTPVEEAAALVDTDTDTNDVIGNIVFLLPSEKAESIPTKFGLKSPVICPSLMEATLHLMKKVNWFSDGRIDASIETVPIADKESEELQARLQKADALIAFGLDSESDLEFCSNLFEARRQRGPSLRLRQCQFAIDSVKPLPSTVGPYDEVSPSIKAKLLPWTKDATGRRMHDQMLGLFERWTSDDFTVALMLFFNQFVSEIDWVKHSIDATWEKGPVRNAQEIYAMATKCGDCIVECLQDEKCKECITALTKVDTRDQVMSYRTIVSYESELLRDFSLCILQKNNIFQCSATIPQRPHVAPITEFRGKPLTSQVARSILVAHLDDDAAPEVSR